MQIIAIAAALVPMVGAAAAQEYPTRPINVIVPAAAGGPTDAISRITAQAMSKVLHDRECWRRWRHYRHRPRGARRPGRLHLANLSRGTRDRGHALSQASLRYEVGIRSDRPRHGGADDDHRSVRSARGFAQGSRRVP